MFTVTFVLVGSGNSSTLNPFFKRYSVMPSTLVVFSTPAGSAWAASGTMETIVNSAAAATRMILKRLVGNISGDVIDRSTAVHPAGSHSGRGVVREAASTR